MRQVIVLSLADDTAETAGGCCGASAGGCGGSAPPDADACATRPPRVPVLRCSDALSAGGAAVEVVTACSDAEIDAALKAVRADEAALVVAAADDGQLRAVLRRLVRAYAPAPSKRPADLPANRTVPDLPPVGILPLTPGIPDIVTDLGLPTDPAAVAAAVLGGRTRRLDLLRNDGGSVTARSAVLGGVDASGTAVSWRGRVEVDDAVLTDGAEPVLACVVTNSGGVEVGGLPLTDGVAADDGRITVAVAVPRRVRRLLRRPDTHLEVRRATGRAVAITPREESVVLVDDGVTAQLTRKRSWWVEPGAWAVYVP
ncbi:diacylglycerol kinase family protein [Luedemannella helvata]|uniref:DAGKc domain-containing protein n=1 Tax=Luedemannella helvata TaxID=349315 RepID=A0ABP4W628_9ACTN